MKTTICGLDCSACQMNDVCSGCIATEGNPSGGGCVRAECCHSSALASCEECAQQCWYKSKIIDDIKALGIDDMEPVTELYSLSGSFVNLGYPLPCGQTVKFLDDRRIYLGTQVHKINTDRCYGIAADSDWILVSEYGENGSDAQPVVFSRRKQQ